MPTRLLLVFVVAALGAALLAQSEMAATGGTPPTVTARGSDYGRILFDGSNRALYAFTRDPRGTTTCYGSCAKAWPPYIVRGTLRPGAGTTRSQLGTTVRRD